LAPLALLLTLAAPAAAEGLPRARDVELQPLAFQARRVADALDLLGAPLTEADRKALQEAATEKDAARGGGAIQAVLDRPCLAGGPVGKADGQPAVRAQPGPAKPELAEQGWRVFLVKVFNPDGVDKVELRADSANALPVYRTSTNRPDPQVGSVGDVSRRF